MADAPKPGTLRVQPDVWAALGHVAKKLGVSSTKLADQVLRDALDMPGVVGVIGQARKASGRPPTALSPDRSACRHPIGRRIGGACAACGASVKA